MKGNPSWWERRPRSTMREKRMGFASFIATTSKLTGRHRFTPPHVLEA
jgi:hypothetical protein